MLTEETLCTVKNRSSSMVVYRIPESNLRREFAPGETKKIPFNELEKLTYQSGGRELLENFLQLVNDEVSDDLNIHREVEYNMSEADIKDLLLTGSLDAFLDALDFAPIGVIDLIKSMAVSLPLTDYDKRQALKDKTGFDVDKALVHIEEEKADEGVVEEKKTTSRRVKTEKKTTTKTTRRTTPEYTIKEEVPTEE